MNVIEKLIAGHRDAKECEDIFHKLAKLIDQDAFFWDNALKVSDFFERELLRHLELEEKVLFPVLKKALSGREAALLAGLEEEHVQMRHMVNTFMKVAQAHLRHSSRFTREQMATIARAVMEIALPHTRREDEVLLPLVKQFFGGEHYRELEDRYFEYLGV
jgi:hemerythrin-like domain-containing protein